MIPMSEDEVLVLLLAGTVGAVVWLRWLFHMLAVHGLFRSRGLALAAIGAVALAGVVLYLILKTLAAHDVRDDSRYVAFYLIMGAAWVGSVVSAFPLLGLNARDDVAERSNVAATVLFAGATLGAMLAFAQANIGDGPGWWCVVFAAALSTGAWVLAWAILEKTAHVSESVTVDRDVATAVRVGVLLAALGLLCGRGAAGDWTSAEQTVIEFAAAWPAIPLLVAGAFIERKLRPAALGHFGSIALHSIGPVILYGVGAFAGMVAVGPPP
jgi:hypothetical protein